MKFLNNIDLLKNQLQNAVIHALATAPGTPVAGQVYYNTGSNKIFYWNGSAWVDLSSIIDVDGTAPIQVNVSGGVATVSIDAATGSNAGSMSAADKTKLDAATDAATAGTLILRDGSGRAKIVDPSAVTDIANKQYVDGLVAGLGQFVGAHDASGGLVPTTGSGSGGAIRKGDWWRITVAGTITGVTPNAVLEVGDVIYANVDAASSGSDFFAVQANVGYASESTPGIVTKSSDAEVVTGTEDTKYVTPKQLQDKVNGIGGGVGKFSASVGNNSATSFQLNHGLNTEDVAVSIRQAGGDKEGVITVWEVDDADNITVRFAVAPATNEYRVTVVG